MSIDINYVNELLKSGKSVKEIRQLLNIPEKSYQREIKKLGFKYNQKSKQYETKSELLSQYDTSMLLDIQDKNIDTENFKNNLIDLVLNYDKIKKIINDYDSVVVSETIKIEQHSSDEVERTTVRISKNILSDWNEFCDNHKQYSKKDLLGQALYEFINKYK